MKQIFDIDSMLYEILIDSPVKNAIDGGIYLGDDRPNDSESEDIVINSIALTQDYHPQLGTSNVNIFVPDMNVTIAGKSQLKTNRLRLQELSAMAITSLRGAKLPGLMFTIENQALLAETSVNQHFINIRISWNIQID